MLVCLIGPLCNASAAGYFFCATGALQKRRQSVGDPTTRPSRSKTWKARAVPCPKDCIYLLCLGLKRTGPNWIGPSAVCSLVRAKQHIQFHRPEDQMGGKK